LRGAIPGLVGRPLWAPAVTECNWYLRGAIPGLVRAEIEAFNRP
jgi:hypothetical protein